jgi:NDP-sugar pyrophosphorylase family protein
MKAILLAGGQGTRLRPLTLHTPKPIVPIFDRPFLHYQIERVKQVPEIDEVILSLNYKPDRIEEVLGHGADEGIPIRYVVEPEPLGTGGAIKFAAKGVTDSVVVFNGDVLTEIDLPAVIALHRQRKARATIVLTPVDNPSAYGLVETDAAGNIQRFVEKPKPEDITTNNINAGIYVLEPDTFDRIPDGKPWSIERGYFPSLVERGETFVAYVYPGYWIDIGTPDKYVEVHRDIMDGRFGAGPFHADASRTLVSPSARVDAGAVIEGPCFVGEGAHIASGARVGPYSVIGKHTQMAEGSVVEHAILWPGCRVDGQASVRSAIVGRNCHIGEKVSVSPGAVLGDGTVLTDYTRT